MITEELAPMMHAMTATASHLAPSGRESQNSETVTAATTHHGEPNPIRNRSIAEVMRCAEQERAEFLKALFCRLIESVSVRSQRNYSRKMTPPERGQVLGGSPRQ
jgi:hypothetical protein